MGTIYRNGKPFIGSASASNVSYDNSSSGLSAANVQAAVDEVNSGLTKLGYTKRITVTVEETANAPLGYYGTTDITSDVNSYGAVLAVWASDSYGYPTPANYVVSGGTHRVGVCARRSGDCTAFVVFHR